MSRTMSEGAAGAAPFKTPDHEEQQRLLAAAHRLRAEALARWGRALAAAAVAMAQGLGERAQRAAAPRRDAV